MTSFRKERPMKNRLLFVFLIFLILKGNLTAHTITIAAAEDLQFVFQPHKVTAHFSEIRYIFHLKGLGQRKPAKLSGDLQHRLEVARALMRKQGKPADFFKNTIIKTGLEEAKTITPPIRKLADDDPCDNLIS